MITFLLRQSGSTDKTHYKTLRKNIRSDENTTNNLENCQEASIKLQYSMNTPPRDPSETILSNI